jgi:hypothetical protein
VAQYVMYDRIVSIDAYRGLIGVPSCIGAKHSSLDRELEWQRLALRDAVRPDFKVYTGNDLAIDMVMWGSDYLLGLSTFAPDLFAIRDARWAAGDRSFYALNDLLQYLGQLAFRAPVPAYRHSAAQFLRLRGWIESDAIPDGQPRRPASDIELLADILRRLEAHLRDGSVPLGQSPPRGSPRTSIAWGSRCRSTHRWMRAACSQPLRRGRTTATDSRPAHGGLGRHRGRPPDGADPKALAELRPLGGQARLGR